MSKVNSPKYLSPLVHDHLNLSKSQDLWQVKNLWVFFLISWIKLIKIMPVFFSILKSSWLFHTCFYLNKSILKIWNHFVKKTNIIVPECFQKDEQNTLEVVVPEFKHSLPRQLDQRQHGVLSFFMSAIKSTFVYKQPHPVHIQDTSTFLSRIPVLNIITTQNPKSAAFTKKTY